MDQLAEALNKSNVKVTKNPDGTLTAAGQSTGLSEIIWRSAFDSGVSIQSLTPSRNSLEEVFLSTVADSRETEGEP